MPFESTHFTSFMRGNGLFRYSEAHPTVAFALCHRSLENRVETSRKILEEGVLSKFADAVRAAGKRVRAFLVDRERFPASESDQETLIADLDQYQSVLLLNYESFLRYLKGWSPDET